MPTDMIDGKAIRSEMNSMVDLITDPAFVDAMKTLKSLSPTQRQKYGRANLTVAALSKKGVKFPAGMRLTTRYFEPGKPGAIEWNPDGTSRVVKGIKIPIGDHSGGTVQWGGCACGGGLTFCGGAGGGT